MNKIDSKKEYIKYLKEKAIYVKEKMGKYRKRRPVVIEFSGAPKSGKTSSINSLMQFLKRNGFKVKVLQESASVCPVKDKHSPMFNIWTACDSIKSLVGELESTRTQYDVIIIDRGVFDAMCWFQWLLNNGKMSQEMKNTMDQFLTMDEIVAYIDIVFVYEVKPEISIEREYASLLTDIPGTIMNREVLTEYLKSIKDILERAKRDKLFRKVECIETSDIDQDDVGKKVTSMTLEILGEMFEEQIGYIELDCSIIQKFKQNLWMPYCDLRENMEIGRNIRFGHRTELEKNYAYVQPIPIAVIKDSLTNQVFVVRKSEEATSEDSQEKDKILSYVGGHIRAEDINGKNENNFLEICKTTLKREVREELGISISLDGIVPYLIYVRDGSKSNLHLAVCFIIEEKRDTLKVRMDSGELLSDGSGQFKEPKEVFEDGNSWSKIILDKCFHVDIPYNISLED